MARFCIECVHFRPSWDLDPSECCRPLTDELSPVTGHPKKRLFAWAYRERKPGKTLFGRKRCGPEAQFFQAKTRV